MHQVKTAAVHSLLQQNPEIPKQTPTLNPVSYSLTENTFAEVIKYMPKLFEAYSPRTNDTLNLQPGSYLDPLEGTPSLLFLNPWVLMASSSKKFNVSNVIRRATRMRGRGGGVGGWGATR